MRKLIVGIALAVALSLPLAHDAAANQTHACQGLDTARTASFDTPSGGILNGTANADERSALSECFGQD